MNIVLLFLKLKEYGSERKVISVLLTAKDPPQNSEKQNSYPSCSAEFPHIKSLFDILLINILVLKADFAVALNASILCDLVHFFLAYVYLL